MTTIILGLRIRRTRVLLVKFRFISSFYYRSFLRRGKGLVSRALKGNLLNSGDESELVNKEIRVYRVSVVKTTKKKSLDTTTHHLINRVSAITQADELNRLGKISVVKFSTICILTAFKY